jgi:hemerythrin-like metal-binding protein
MQEAMRLFQWSKSHSVYVPEMDAEHRALILLGKELHEAAESGAGSDVLRQCVRALIASLEDHLSHEEHLMRTSRYSSFEWHKRQHDGARRQLKHFASRIEGGDTEAPAQLLEYLSSWLRDHTGVTDRLFAAHLRGWERGRVSPQTRATT